MGTLTPFFRQGLAQPGQRSFRSKQNLGYKSCSGNSETHHSRAGSTKSTRSMMMMKRTMMFLLLAVAVTHVQSVYDGEQIYNNELFPRTSKYGKLQGNKKR